MLQASPKTPPKHKRRKVSAIRQFPRGCGPNAIKLRPVPVKNTPVLVGLENGKVTDTDNVLAVPNDSKKTLTSSLLSLEKDTLDASEKTLASSLLALEKDTLDASESVKGPIPELAELPVSSAVLENSTEITKLDVQPLTENCDTLGDKVELKAVTKKVEMEQDMKINNILEVDIECNPQKVILEVLQVSGESAEPPRLQNKHLYSKMYGHPRRRKVSAIREFPPNCGPNAVSIRKDNNPLVFTASYLDVKSLVEVKADEAGKHLVGDDSIGVATFDSLWEKLKKNDGKGDQAKNDLHTYENLPQEKRSIGVGESLRVAAAENSLNHEKSIMKQRVAIDESEKASSCEKTGIADQKISKLTKGKERTIVKSDLSRSNSTKNFRIKSIGSHDLIKSSLKSNSNEKSLLKIVSDETLIPSSSGRIIEDIKAGRTANSIHAKANASNPSHLVVKSHSGNKRLDEKDMPLMEKSIGIENEFNQKSSKKKMLPGEMHKGYTPGENDDSFGAIGERMIIQALMAAMNCPWRNTKRRSSVTSDSVVSKNKISKEKRIVVNSLVSKDLVPYEPKCKGFTADDDVILDGDNELTIMMTPFVPPETSKKGGDDDVVAWHKVKRALRLFQLICRKLLQGEESRSKRLGKSNRIDLLAAGILKDNGEWVNTGESILGVVPGVEVGDEFHFRVELSVVGLHRPFQGGIDSVKKNGLLLATSIVASGGHQDDMDSSDVLIYSGAGGTTAVGGDKQQGDQKLERGNLALKNSIAAQTPVRVIHGFKEKGIDPHDARGKLISTFTYDGLYQVEAFWQEIGSNGFNVFKFQLRRRPGQPELALKELKRSAKLKNREGLCVKDISKGKEKIPISVVNTIDTDQPMPFKYITKSIYPSWYTKTPPKGCDCTDGCSDSDKCACAVKNGGEIPYNYNGAIVQAKPLIYECGPSCKCSLSCHNRVGQRGIRIKLEIFKTRGRGWGVRSLKSIPSGYFICEYIGELLQDGEAEQRTNDEYLFDIGHNYDDHSLWEDLPNLIPGLQSKSEYDTVESVGFTIDAAEYGNVGRFINHSCSPNLYAQNVLYDHDDKRMPHIMFFAVDNIPPLQELTYHYNYTIDQVRDSEGNIKQKACHCGSPECCGRLY